MSRKILAPTFPPLVPPRHEPPDRQGDRANGKHDRGGNDLAHQRRINGHAGQTYDSARDRNHIRDFSLAFGDFAAFRLMFKPRHRGRERSEAKSHQKVEPRRVGIEGIAEKAREVTSPEKEERESQQNKGKKKKSRPPRRGKSSPSLRYRQGCPPDG